jgi:hypothetical protein
LKNILLIIAFLLSFNVSAATKTAVGISIKDGVQTTIFFVNGINNNRPDVASSSDQLMAQLQSNGVDTSKVNWKYFYNPTNWLTGDVRELQVQARISANFSTASSDANYYRDLGGLYDDLIKNGGVTKTAAETRVLQTTKDLYDQIVLEVEQKGRKLVIVPHSQGNFYVEAAYALLTFNNKTSVLSNIKVVGIATISMRTPSKRFLTIEQDQALFTAQYMNTIGVPGYAPLPAKHKAFLVHRCLSSGTCYSHSYADLRLEVTNLMHEFVDVYLRSDLMDYNSMLPDPVGYWNAGGSRPYFPKIIAGMIQDSINELNPVPKIPPVITSIGFSTVIAGTSTTFNIFGTNLPTSRLDITFGGCANIAFLTQTTTEHTFSCTPQAAGNFTVDFRETASGPILRSYSVVVSAAPVSILPSVSSVSPTTAQTGLYTAFTVVGAKLPLTAVISIADATCDTPTNRSANGFTAVCLLGGGGSKVVTVKTDIAANSGTVIDQSKSINVGASAGSAINWTSDTRVSSDFVKLNAAGTPLSDSATSWACIKDNATGLIWENKTNDGSIQDLQGLTAAGGIQALYSTLSQKVWCGRTDWRMPNAIEMYSLTSFDGTPGTTAFPKMVTDKFSSWSGGGFWITGPVGGSAQSFPANIWMDSNTGTLTGADPWYGCCSGLFSRSVAGDLPLGTNQLQYSIDGKYIYDPAVNITWNRCALGGVPTLTGATASCVGSASVTSFSTAQSLAGQQGNGWRLPTAKELITSHLVTNSGGTDFSYCCIGVPHGFVFITNIPQNVIVWSSTRYDDSANSKIGLGDWWGRGYLPVMAILNANTQTGAAIFVKTGKAF